MADNGRLNSFRRYILLSLVLLITTGLSWLAVDWPLSRSLSTVSVQESQVAPQDILAPYAVSYVSNVLTEQKKEEAAGGVVEIYTNSDTSIARQQLKQLREVLNFIETVRQDEYATPEQKLTDLTALEDIRLSSRTASALLALNDARWHSVRQEAIVVLEQVMRSTIREHRLEQARQNVPSLVSLSLPEEEVKIVSEIVAAFVAPNSFYSEEQTEEAREAAREETPPITRSIAAGETILRRGEIARADDIEALEQVGLMTSYGGWETRAGAIAIVLLMSILLVLFFLTYPELTYQPKKLILVASLFLVFLGLGRLTVTGHVVLPYLFPVAAYSLIVSALIDRKTALFSTIPLAILMAYGLPNPLDLTLYYAVGGNIGVLAMRRPRRIASYIPTAGIIAVSGAVIVAAYRVLAPGTDIMGLVTLFGAAVFYGAASVGLTIFIEYTLAPLLGLTTTLQLMELTRPDHPLLQYLLQEAPGTYQHTLQMANLVEQAAEHLGADSLLARVGALYHDVGKTQLSAFYVENQVPGQLNTHDELDPAESAQLIIQHVPEGIKLARKHNLPKRVQDFILEHHGDSLARYQYTQALNAADGDESQVDISKFQYPGPKPQSVETALVMLADGSEAYARAKRPDSEEDLRGLIKEMVDKRVESGQLDDTPLTLKDLTDIIDSFTATLKGTYHSRVNYPTVKKKPSNEEDTVPVAGEAVAMEG